MNSVTNAARLGALSVYGGKVEVTWSVIVDAVRRTLTFDWVESGGPVVTQPARRGIGSRLLAFVLPGQIQAKTSVEYAPTSACRVHCSLPLPTGNLRGFVICGRGPACYSSSLAHET